MAESTAQLLAQLTGVTRESAEAIYAAWRGVSGESLAQLVVRHAASADRRESLEATVAAGGGAGESPEAELLRTGLVGW